MVTVLRDVNEFEIRSKEAMNKPVKAAPLGCMKCKMRRLHPGNGSSHSQDAAEKHDAKTLQIYLPTNRSSGKNSWESSAL